MNVRLRVKRAGVKQFPTNTCQLTFFMSDSCLSVCTLGSALLCTELWICSFTPQCSGGAVSLLRLCFYQTSCLFFSGVGYSLFHHSPCSAPPDAWKSSESKFTFLPHAISSCFWFLPVALNMLGDSSQGRCVWSFRNFIASQFTTWTELYFLKYWFFIGDCIRIWALHRIISIVSNCSSSSGFALSLVLAHNEHCGVFCEQDCAGSLWGWCGSPGLEDFLLSIDFWVGTARISLYL